MNNPLLKKIIPHLIAVVIFLVVSILFCKPVLEGNVLSQGDIIGWKGMAQNAFAYKEKNGHFPLWNPNLFSGMPNYQIAMEGKTILPDMVKILSLGMPKPINFFFLAAICFYILCLTLRIRPVIGILGGLAFAFSTYNPVIINAGHETQMLATAFMPLLMAGLICTFEKKYWLGLALTTFGTYQQIGVNHLQISYYFFLVAIAVTISYVYDWIKQKEWKHMAIAGAIVAVSAVVGLAGNALSLKTTSEYAKYTMRGGKDISIEGGTVKAAKTSGLDTSYAFIYSIGKAEISTLMMPNAFGGASNKEMGEGSHVVGKLTAKGVDETQAEQVASRLPRYWGALPYTAGPAYLGIITCLLGLIGFVIVKTPLRWALLAATVLGIFMSWGKYFGSFNTFLFEYLPMYNKFRAPSMAQVIPQFTIGIIAVLALQKILFEERTRELIKADFKRILYVMGGLFAFLALMYLAMDYSSPGDGPLSGYLSEMTKNNDEITRLIFSGLKADRRAMFGGQFLRALGFGVLLLGLLYLYMKDRIKPLIVAIALITISTLELTLVSKEYLGEESYVSPDEITSTNFTPNANDQQLLQDKDPSFRVFNMAADTYNEARTSYFHKSIGGYHPAKLRIYQDVIEKYLSGSPNRTVLNILNAKYFLVQNPQSGEATLIPNPDALGHCWLVKNVKLVSGSVEEIQAIGSTNLKDTAIVDKSFSQLVVQPQWDSASTIKLTKFDNDVMEYEAVCAGPQFAVFSEIYYPKGWNAYVDGKKTEYCNADYVLRGISLPAGKHSIKFAFEPTSYKQGVKNILHRLVLYLDIFPGWFIHGLARSQKNQLTSLMRKVLAIAPYSYLPFYSGGQKFIAQFFEFLAQVTDLTVISVPENDFTLANNYRGIPMLKSSFSRYVDRSLIRKIVALVRKERFDTIIWEHPYFAWLAFRIKRRTGIFTIIHSHNIEFQRFRSTHRWWWPILRKYEKWSFKKADCILFITPEDRGFAIEQWKINEQKCIELPFGMTINSYPTDRLESRQAISEKYGLDKNEKILLFTGALSYKPNLDAVRAIREKINPFLASQPGFRYKILICGKGLPEEMNSLKDEINKNIIYTGFVEDVDTYYKASSVFLNAVQTGGGIKTKMVEAIGFGSTVIATNTAAKGIDARVCGENLITVDDNDWKEFAEKAIERSKEDAVTPPSFYTTYYWKNIIQKLMTSLANRSSRDTVSN